jgi:hypothetical protein
MNAVRPNIPLYTNQLIQFHTEMFEHFLETGDSEGISESSGILCLAYAVQGNSVLAKKWAENFFAHLPAANSNHP